LPLSIPGVTRHGAVSVVDFSDFTIVIGTVTHAIRGFRDKVIPLQPLGHTVTWKCNVDGKWIPYSDALSESLEDAFLRRATDFRFKDRSHDYSIDMTLPSGLEQRNVSTGVRRPVRRLVEQQDDELQAYRRPPATWAPQPDGKNCELFDVASGTPEFKAVEDRVKATMPRVRILVRNSSESRMSSSGSFTACERLGWQR
jgi:hypothetical protein